MNVLQGTEKLGVAAKSKQEPLHLIDAGGHKHCTYSKIYSIQVVAQTCVVIRETLVLVSYKQHIEYSIASAKA